LHIYLQHLTIILSCSRCLVIILCLFAT